jgi:hypothetical protein
MEREEFSLYYTECIKKALTDKPDVDVAEISVDTRKTVVRPLHAKSLCRIFEKFSTTAEGKRIIANGFKASGITAAVNDCRSEQVEDLNDPFASLSLSD